MLAQGTPTCEPLLAEAEAHYVSLEFKEAERLVRTCLTETAAQEGEAQQAYRLLALVKLRQDDLPEAKQAVLRLLSISFDYEPDAVQDPPAYVALVTSVKDQLRVAQSADPDSSATARPPREAEPETPPEILIAQSNSPEDAPPPDVRVPVRENNGTRRWLMIGGGALAVGLAAVLLTSGGSPSTSPGGAALPPPPGFPR